MTNVKRMILIAALLVGFSACKKDKDPIIIVPPSEGVEKITFNGIAAAEEGSVAGNSVFLDLSTDKTSAVLRAGWDLGFYCGNEFRVIINNTATAGVKVLDKFYLASVTAEDTAGLTLTFEHYNPLPGDLAFYDDAQGDLSKTVIPGISATENSNPVIILNRGTGGDLAPRPWVKLRVLRNGDGYTLQYAGIQETGFHTVNIPKNADFNFQFVSLDGGNLVTVQPEKEQWDLVWTYSVFETSFGEDLVPYNFSDLIAVNYLAHVQTKEIVYADAATATAAYAAFDKDSIAAHPVVSGRWAIGSRWRSTMPAIGAKQDRFYLIKDTDGNYYKFKAIAMGAGTDGGTRGKPDFKYALIAQ